MDGLTIIEGRENSFGHHIIGVGCKMVFDEDIIGKPAVEYEITDHQKVIDAIADDGGFAILAHPHWAEFDYWSKEQAITLERYTAIEIINGDVFNGPSNLATDVWDAALTAGRRGFFTAVFPCKARDKS
jgi:hypothetical protein